MEMKNRLMAFFVIALLGFAVAPQMISVSGQNNHEQKAQKSRDYDHDGDYSERDEVNQSYQLASGAAVEVRGINGTVDIETHNGSTAEVHIVRSARNRDDLNYQKVI